MKEFTINKGIGRPVEFKGLKSQYLFIFIGGLLGDFLLFTILYMIGISQMVCICIAVLLGLLVVWGTFHLNDKYGEYGLMKLTASKNHPRYIINRFAIRRLLNHSSATAHEKRD